MVEKVNSLTRQYNYNTISSVKNTTAAQPVNTYQTQPAFTAFFSSKTPQSADVSLRTT